MLDRWPGGGSRVGLVLGLLAGLIFCFEAALPLRRTRWFRTVRVVGNGRLWMKAHIWLGLLTVPLVVLHSGFRTGGLFTTWFMCIFGIVIVSGVVGLTLQNVVPRMMLELVHEETIFSQIPVISRQMVEESERLMRIDVSTLELLHGKSSQSRSQPSASSLPSGRVVVGAKRRVGEPLIRTPAGTETWVSAEISALLQQAFLTEIRPFLETGRSPSGNLLRQRTSERYFQTLRQSVDAAGDRVVDQLEQLCRKRRDFNLQSKLHWILHGWLLVHLPLSVLLLAMLVIHIVYALRFG